MNRGSLALVGAIVAMLGAVALWTISAGDTLAGCIALATLAAIAREVWTATRKEA